MLKIPLQYYAPIIVGSFMILGFKTMLSVEKDITKETYYGSKQLPTQNIKNDKSHERFFSLYYFIK